MSVFKYFASSSSDSGLDDKDICRMPPLERAIRHCCTSRSWSGSRYTGKLWSGIMEKIKESDLVMKVKLVTAMLGTKYMK